MVRRRVDLPPPFFHSIEAKSQSIVMDDEMMYCLAQCVWVYGSADFKQEGLIEMVGVGLILLEEPVLNWGEWHLPGDGSLLCLNQISRVGHCRKLGYRLVLKYLPGSYSQPRLVSTRYDLYAQNRISAELKEIIIYPYSFYPENSAPDVGQ